MENKNKNLPLPEDLVPEILLRLPVKSLLRFKCVCKLWLSQISDPNFAKSHSDLAAAPTQRLLYIDVCGSETRSIDIEASLLNDSTAPKLNLPLRISPARAHIRGSCGGFILLDNHPNLILWNPSTGVHKILSCSGIVANIVANITRSFYGPLYGFGYDASTDDYLVIIASAWFKHRHIEHDFGIEVIEVITFGFFSVRTNLWKEIEGIHFPYGNPQNQSGLFFNGAIHWLASSREHGKFVKVIISFNLIEKNLSEVSLPEHDFDFIYGCFGDLWITGGCLGLCYWRRGDNKTEMWVMKEYKVQSSWTKYEIPWSCISPICSTKSGELVAYARSGRLMKFNDKGQLLEHCTYSDDPRGCKAVMYTENLLSLPNIYGEATEDDQQ